MHKGMLQHAFTVILFIFLNLNIFLCLYISNRSGGFDFIVSHYTVIKVLERKKKLVYLVSLWVIRTNIGYSFQNRYEYNHKCKIN